MIYTDVFTIISAVLTALCLIWCIGLGLFVLIRMIVRKIKFKRLMKQEKDKIVEVEGERFYEDE